jgi:hypothetical protein
VLQQMFFILYLDVTLHCLQRASVVRNLTFLFVYRYHGRHSGDADLLADKLQRDSVRQPKSPQQTESPRLSEKLSKAKDSVPSRLQKLAMESDIKVSDMKKPRKGSPGRDYAEPSSSSYTGSGSKKNVISPAKSRDAKGVKSSKSKDDASPSREKDYRNRSPGREQRKERDASPMRGKPKPLDSKAPQSSKDSTGKVQKHATKRARKASSSSSSSGSSSSSDSSSGSSSSGSSSSSSSSSSAASSPRRGRKAGKRDRDDAAADRKKDDHSKRHHNPERVAETDDRQGHGSYESKADVGGRIKESASQKLVEAVKSDERDRRRKDQPSPQLDSGRRRDNGREDDRWRSETFGDASKKTDREKSIRDNFDDRRRVNDLSPRSQKPLRDDRDNDRRKRESPLDRYSSKPSSGRYDRDEQHDSGLMHDIPSYEQREPEMNTLSERMEDRDARHTPRSDREHFGERYHTGNISTLIFF